MNGLYIPDIQLKNESSSNLDENLKQGMEVEFDLNENRWVDELIQSHQESHRRWFPYFIFCFDTGRGSTKKIRCDFRGFQPGTANMVYESIKTGNQLRVIFKYK